jgi:hypothetical protein
MSFIKDTKGLGFSFKGRFRNTTTGGFTAAPTVNGFRTRSKNAIRSQVTTTGLNTYLKILRNLPASYHVLVEPTFIRISKHVLRIADHYVPTETGALRGTGHVVTTKEYAPGAEKGAAGVSVLPSPRREPGSVNKAIAIEYGGRSAPYAIFVHENPEAAHGAEYLAKQLPDRIKSMRSYELALGGSDKFRKKLTVGKGQNHRPQEQYKWMERAWNEAYPYIEAQLNKLVRSVIAKTRKDSRVANDKIVTKTTQSQIAIFHDILMRRGIVQKIGKGQNARAGRTLSGGNIKRL